MIVNDRRELAAKEDRHKDNAELIRHMIRKYNDNKEYTPVKNASVRIETEDNVYRLIRLNDEQYFLLRKNSIAISEDYSHLMSLSMNRDIIYSSFSKMYVTLKALFGESGKYYDDWKGAFSFPFLIHFHKGEEEFGYVMNLMSLRSSVEFHMARLIHADDDKFRRDILHEPFEEFPRDEIRYFINFFIGFLSGYFKATAELYTDPFFKTVDSNLILFGYRDGHFFDEQYDNSDEFDDAIRKLTELKSQA